MNTKGISDSVKDAFIQAIDVLAKDNQSNLTDIFITVDKESGEVAFFNDEDSCVVKTVLSELIDKVDDMSDEEMISILRSVTEQLDDEDRFSALNIYMPFSVNYADENLIVIEELLLISDDSTVIFNNDLLEKFDKDFDEFLDRILKE